MGDMESVELLRRQYLQLLDPEELAFPGPSLLRLPDVQARIYETIFEESKLQYAPPERYRYRVLKRLVKALEQSIEDPEEDEISDDISTCLAQFMSHSLQSASEAAQQKSYVTYTAPLRESDAPRITLLEAPSLLASSGTTGFRTWEAALHLGSYLVSEHGRSLVSTKNVLELGAGTGFISILCAKHLGTRHVLATDGSQEVVNGLKTNISVSGLDESEKIGANILQWGHALIGGIADCRAEKQVYDLAIGADVTYDLNSIPALVATIRDLFELYPKIGLLISATIRNEDALACFVGACETNNFEMQRLYFPQMSIKEQTGFFFRASAPIEMYMITNTEKAKDAFAV